MATSHKNKRRNQKQAAKATSNGWRPSRAAIVIVSAMALLGAAFIFAPSIENDVPEDFVPEVTGAPRVSLSQDFVDFGDVQLNQTVEAVFHVTNVGDEVLNILDEPVVEVKEGCCPPRAVVSDTEIEPGTEATITLRFMMHEGMGGQHDFRLHLNTNDPEEPNKEIVILSNWVA